MVNAPMTIRCRRHPNPEDLSERSIGRGRWVRVALALIMAFAVALAPAGHAIVMAGGIGADHPGNAGAESGDWPSPAGATASAASETPQHHRLNPHDACGGVGHESGKASTALDVCMAVCCIAVMAEDMTRLGFAQASAGESRLPIPVSAGAAGTHPPPEAIA
ncbi:MAG: hypothetical protein EA405_00035 [Rhodospirillales bacterium]|nr:MAG: hypothetical protein EA405_00035 [Rhodospirillales bacterium]